MNRAAHDELRAFEDEHAWFRGRRAAVAPHVRRGLARGGAGVVLDVGCGTGANSAWLSQRAGRRLIVGLEPEPYALELARRRGLAVHFICADAARLPVASGSATLILCCDVLEHIEDDRAACRELARVLAPGGLLVATVPTGPGLWSQHDLALGHRRRYRRGELEQRLREAGLAIDACHGFNLALWPVIWAVRRFRRSARTGTDDSAPTTDFMKLPAPINAALAFWLSIESALLRALRVRFGVSIVVRARRP
jgi:SAM-dependent methyltransferase